MNKKLRKSALHLKRLERIIKPRFRFTCMKVLLFGASGAGTTTLAQKISENNSIKHLDVDDYYWQKT